MKRVLIAGATGMVGNLFLKRCLSSDEVNSVHVLGRRSLGLSDSKLSESVLTDFADYTDQAEAFQNIDIACFCIGVYTGQVSDELFKKITIDYALSFARALKENSPEATLCFLSGAGADRTGKSRMAFAKYKGIAEREIAAMDLKAFYTFRPAYIYPVERRKEPSIVYSISRMLYPIIKLFGKNASIISVQLADAMFAAGLSGAPREILENQDILELLG